MAYTLLKELLVFHGGPDVIRSGIKVPFFTTPSKSGAGYYAIDRAHRNEMGKLNIYDLNTTKSNTLDAVNDFEEYFKFAIDVGIDMNVKSADDLYNESFWSDEVAEAGMDGSNTSDLVYVPRFREALLKAGHKIVKISDVLTNGEITAYIVLDPSVIKFTGYEDVDPDDEFDDDEDDLF